MNNTQTENNIYDTTSNTGSSTLNTISHSNTCCEHSTPETTTATTSSTVTSPATHVETCHEHEELNVHTSEHISTDSTSHTSEHSNTSYCEHSAHEASSEAATVAESVSTTHVETYHPHETSNMHASEHSTIHTDAHASEHSTIHTDSHASEHSTIHTDSHASTYSSTHADSHVSTHSSNCCSSVKTSVTELQKIVQKLEKLEKMINPNSKKSLILWEEDNSFKNLISSIVTYATTCDTAEFPIELLDRLKALAADVDKQIAEGAVKVEELTKQAKINTELSEVLSSVYIAAMAGTPVEEYEEKIQNPEISSYKEHLAVISTAVPESEEYLKAEKAIKSKITNLENSVHITIDLERTTSKGGALQYIKVEVAPAVERLQAAYDEQYKVSEATEINGEEAIMALAVRKTFTEKVYDTFVRPFANFFKRRSKAK